MTLRATVWLLTAVFYALSGGLSFASLWRGDQRAQPWAMRALAIGVGTHFLFIGLTCITGATPLDGIHNVLGATAFILTTGHLMTMRRERLAVLGAFVMPVALLMLLGAGLGDDVARVSDGARAALLPVHVSVNVLGIAAFTLAFAVAIAYIIQERMLRRRQLGGVFKRLPALDVLDSLGLRLVTIGFPLFTIGVLTGTMWTVRLGGNPIAPTTAQGFALLAWAFFGAVLFARAAAGWRGRRAAIGTVLGFVCAMAAMVGYLMRGVEG